MEQNNSSRNGISFCGLLTIVFIVLKLVGVIQWSWIWVLSPIWIPVLLVIAFVAFFSWLLYSKK